MGLMSMVLAVQALARQAGGERSGRDLTAPSVSSSRVTEA